MKLTETVLVSEWIDGTGWLYEDSIVSIKEFDFPDLLYYDPEEFNWNDYEEYIPSSLPKGTDLLILVEFSTPDDGVVYSNSEWVSVLNSYKDIVYGVCV